MQLAIRKTGSSPKISFHMVFWITLGLSITTICYSLVDPNHGNVSAAAKPHLIVFDPNDRIPAEVLADFQQDFQIDLTIVNEANFQTGDAEDAYPIYDVAISRNNSIPNLIKTGKLAELHFNHIPNFKNISPDFRDLSYDPGNQYSIPFNWGTTGLIIRNDIEEPPAYWKDLWDDKYKDQIVVRSDHPYDLIGLTMKSLGYSINSDRQNEFNQALAQLQALRPNLILVDSQEEAIDMMVSDRASIMIGQAEDVANLRPVEDSIVYQLPHEGTMLWGENLVISSGCAHTDVAESLVNYLLRPDISARLANERLVATPNTLARSQIEVEVLNNPAVFPQNEDLIDSEVFMPHNSRTYSMYQETWQKFTLENDTNH